MNAVIETYRGFDIIFNTDSERFSFCLDEGNYREKQSYAACKKSIDDFVKDNQEFKPFIVSEFRNRNDKRKIVGMRKDGRFAAEDKDGKRSQLSEYEEKNYILYLPEDEQHYAQIAILESEIDELRKTIKETYAKIKSPTLVDIKKDFSLIKQQNQSPC